MKRQKGFSLIELLIVVAIILIIAAIAIPNLMRSRISANEASAVASIRTIDTAEISYATTYPDKGFALTLDLLGPNGGAPPTDAKADLIDSTLASGTKSGYSFTSAGSKSSGNTGTANDQFAASALPQNVGKTGIRSFCSNQSAVITYDATGADCAASTTVIQ